MNSHKNTLSNIFCKIRPRTLVRSLVYVCSKCVYECNVGTVCTYAHMRVRGMYMPIMAVKDNVHYIKNPRAYGATYRVSLFVFDTACDSRMKASFPN